MEIRLIIISIIIIMVILPILVILISMSNFLGRFLMMQMLFKPKKGGKGIYYGEDD